ncbi:MAG: AAA family ATPase [Actinobacteria bacterium]|nr:AAA family ATPase [Actinomycetota bacterium]
MGNLTERVLHHLKKSGFSVRGGGARPFGEELPLVTGTAWESGTAQLALLAEGRGDLDLAPWQQLLFAGSGIRHQLTAEDVSAYGTPVIVAIVDEQAAGRLRELAETLAEDYAVFSRVDLTMVLETDIGVPERLDDALAPLLPRCRRILKSGGEISRKEVQRFWGLLETEVKRAADELDPAFGAHRATAGRDGARKLAEVSPGASELPSPTPLRNISIKHFRSIELLGIDLADVNVVHGPNGSGKTSLVEAMELAWAGTSERRPPDVALEEYSAHLPRGGSGSFSIAVDGKQVEAPVDDPRAALSRCVLTHEAMSSLASESPKDRFGALLEITGLEIPDVKARTESLIRESKRNADEMLSRAGFANLRATNAVALKHLRDELRSDFAERMTALPDVAAIEEALGSISRGAFQIRKWKAEPRAFKALIAADEVVSRTADLRAGTSEIAPVFDDAISAVDELLAEREAAAAASRALLEQLREQFQAQREASDPEADVAGSEIDARKAPIGVEVAARWLGHSESLTNAAKQFRADAAGVQDEKWAELLRSYAAAIEHAAQLAPVDGLRELSRPAPPQIPLKRVTVDPGVQGAAGFSTDPIEAATVGPVLRELADALDTHLMELRSITQRLERHPAREFSQHADALMQVLCQFELARTIRREGPILQASETLVSELLDERLAPVVRELVAAIVRFDWYFQPLKMSSGSRKIVLGGLATDREDLDARLLLNSAERTVLGLSWFLALHMLQPSEERQVLVLDDPTAVFDTSNTAGFASTLRAFTRLLKPKQVVIATHDDQVAAMLAEELADVDGWPQSVARIRFRRNAQDCSEAIKEWTASSDRRVDRESEQLGLVGEIAG